MSDYARTCLHMNKGVFRSLTFKRQTTDYQTCFPAVRVLLVWALCTALPGKPLFLPAPSGKEWICVFNQIIWKDQEWAGNMLMFHVDVTMKRLGTRFNDSESTLSFERQELYTRCTFRFKTLQDVFIHLELCYTLHERSSSKIHNRGTLKAN